MKSKLWLEPAGEKSPSGELLWDGNITIQTAYGLTLGLLLDPVEIAWMLYSPCCRYSLVTRYENLGAPSGGFTADLLHCRSCDRATPYPRSTPKNYAEWGQRTDVEALEFWCEHHLAPLETRLAAIELLELSRRLLAFRGGIGYDSCSLELARTLAGPGLAPERLELV